MSINRQFIAPRNNLDEVSFARPILILQVVLYHAMAIHVGSWDMPEGVLIIPAYQAIGKIVYAFMLEAFVFISGYVWAYQRETKGKVDSMWKLCLKKAQRLILPSIIFGIIYILLYHRDQLDFIHIIEGPGHLWFLPMLFECFIAGWCILSIKHIPPIWIVVFLFAVAVIRPMGLPLRLSYTMYYLPFFMSGYYIYREYDLLRDKSSKTMTITSWIAFLLFYFGLVLVRGRIITSCHNQFLLQVGKEGCTVLYASIGIFALLMTSIYVTRTRRLSKWYVQMGGFCMGVYVFQQFVLWGLYYKTPFLHDVNPYVAPWIGFSIALTVSWLLTYILKKIKIGNYLF